MGTRNGKHDQNGEVVSAATSAQNQAALFEELAKSQDETKGADASDQVGPAAKAEVQRKKRINRSFPAGPFEEAVKFALEIFRISSGNRVRKLTLFDQIKKSPESGASRQLIINASRYGLINGSKTAEHLELTPEGVIAVNPESPPRDQLRARFALAIERIEPFAKLYSQFSSHNNKLPAIAVLRDFLLEQKYHSDEVKECVDTFIVNVEYLGLLKTKAGAERLLTLDDALDDLPQSSSTKPREIPAIRPQTGENLNSVAGDWKNICFYITPIGGPDTEHRQHSDLFLESLVKPALEEFGLHVIRADHIAEPGMITSQIVEHIVRSRLVIADLSFHNPNVFYELAIRHVCRLPVVQIIRKADPIPFDLNQMRTINIDNTDLYSFVPKMDVYRADIASQVRRALDDPDSVDTPISVYFPNMSVSIPA